MRNGFLAVAVVGALASTSALAGADDARGRNSGHSRSGGTAVARQGSNASRSGSGRSSEYRSPAPRYSQDHSVASRYRAGGGRGYSGYHRYSYPSYRYRPSYGYRSYYRPGVSLYLGAPLYDSYYYGGGYYPETYATAPYAAAPYPPDYSYGAPAAGDEDTQAPYDNRDFDGPAEAPGSSRLRLDVRPADATIYVDDQFRGTARDSVITLTPGRHSVEVARPGFQSERRVVDVGTGEARPLSITLQPLRR